MTQTYVDKPSEQSGSGACADLAKVYRREDTNLNWTESSLWHLAGLAGAGAIRPSLADMRRFLSAEMDLDRGLPNELRAGIERSKSRLNDAESDIQNNLCAPNNPNVTTCNRYAVPMYLGWLADIGRVSFYHAGQTGSSESMIMLSQDGELGLVILSNSVPSPGPDGDVGHVPNDLAMCIFQLAGKPLGQWDACSQF